MNTVPSLVRMLGAAALVAGTTAGCAPPPEFATLHLVYQATVSGFPDVPVTRQYVDASPYALLYTKLGSGPRSIVVLGVADRRGQQWFSEDGKGLLTKHGRLVAITGFGGNLLQRVSVAPDPLATIHLAHSGGPPSRAVHAIMDMSFDNLQGIVVRCDMRVLGPQVIEHVGVSHRTLQVSESCRAPALDWQFENLFWVDAETGFIWQSIQHATPHLPPFDIQVLKPGPPEL